MFARSQALSRESDQLFKSLVKRRSRPYVIVFDEHGRVAFTEPQALALFETRYRPIQGELTSLIHRLSVHDLAYEQIIGPVSGLILRFVPLSGPHGKFYAVFFEEEARREDLKEAVTRFSFTPREVEVLDRILNGMNAAEIAEELCIAEVTVFDHFKHISHKTKARNRADMLAKIFNWQPSLKSETPEKSGVDRRAAHESRIH